MALFHKVLNARPDSQVKAVCLRASRDLPNDDDIVLPAKKDVGINEGVPDIVVKGSQAAVVAVETKHGSSQQQRGRMAVPQKAEEKCIVP